MAWFAVQQNVFGGKLRKLAEKIGCSENEAFGLLGRLWAWGLDNATKEGKIESATEKTLAAVLTSGIDERYSPRIAVDAMIEVGWIDLAEDDNLYFHDWDEWQGEWYKALKRRENDALRKRISREMAAKTAGLSKTSDNPPDGPTENPADAPKIEEEVPPTMPAKPKYDPEFEVFWKAYPRQVEKGNAYKKYMTRRKDGYSAEDLLTAARNYAAQCRRQGTQKEYIKHPKTFLSDSLPFTDFLPKREEVIADGANPFAEYKEG